MSNIRSAGFLSDTYFADEQMPSERTIQADGRRKRALCEICGRALHVATIDPREVQLLCSCGFRTRALRNSKAYRAATLRAEAR